MVKLDLWQNTYGFTDWFRNMKNMKIMNLSLNNFTPIPNILYNNTFIFARKSTTISEHDIDIIIATRNTIIKFEGDLMDKKFFS